MLFVLLWTTARGDDSFGIRGFVPTPGVSVTPADRTRCAAIGDSDLRSPAEGVWYQAHCTPQSPNSRLVSYKGCNCPSMDDPRFREVSDGLYSYRQSDTSRAYLWYASGAGCYDLVSDRVVTAVCWDRSITFSWDSGAACYTHGGVLARQRLALLTVS